MPKATIKDDFLSLVDYKRWVDMKMRNLSPANSPYKNEFDKREVTSRISARPHWYGRNVTFEELDSGVTTYKDPALIEKIYNQVSHGISSELVNRIKRRKIQFNARGLGVFCFDRAATTLFRLKEWYSPSRKQKVLDEHVIQEEGRFLHHIDKSPVEQRWEQTEDGRKKARTATKDVFAWFPPESRENHAVEFYISGEVSADAKAADMLYGGISAIILAELLVMAGIKVKINLVTGSATTPERQHYVGCVIPIKDYDETVDRNLLALMTSDPRFMRFDTFKGVIAGFDHFGLRVPGGMGYPMNGYQLKKMFEESGYAIRSQAKHRYYFGGSLSEVETLRIIKETVEDLARKIKST